MYPPLSLSLFKYIASVLGMGKKNVPGNLIYRFLPYLTIYLNLLTFWRS